jgi:hypothetical protein
MAPVPLPAKRARQEPVADMETDSQQVENPAFQVAFQEEALLGLHKEYIVKEEQDTQEGTSKQYSSTVAKPQTEALDLTVVKSEEQAGAEGPVQEDELVISATTRRRAGSTPH